MRARDLSANTRDNLIWPDAAEYDRAMLDWSHTIHDPEVRSGALFRDATGPIHLGGGIVCAYRVSDWVIRCLTRHPPPDLAQRYQAITEHLAAYADEHPQDADWIVPCAFVDPGIYLGGQDWPIVKVALVKDGAPLGAFINEHRHDHEVMRALAERWAALMAHLRTARVAHGDLDLTNVLVCGAASDMRLRLIDYDGMYVPTLAGRALMENGHEHFQPLDAAARHFDADMDNFSALVIYLSIAALAEDPTLWDTCQADEGARLLLGADDFANMGLSLHVAALNRKGTPAVWSCMDALAASIEAGAMPPALDVVLATPPRERTTPVTTRQADTFSPPIPTGQTLALFPSATARVSSELVSATPAPGPAVVGGLVNWSLPDGQPGSSVTLVTTRLARRRRVVFAALWTLTILVTIASIVAAVMSVARTL